MVLGFHYHVPAVLKNDKICIPGYLGVFIDSLSPYFKEIVLFLHSPMEYEMKSMNYEILSKNIKLINIGPHSALHTRLITKSFYASSYIDRLSKIDIFLIRGPSPLIFHFENLFKGKTFIYLVGDYLEGLKTLNIGIFKYVFLSFYYRYYHIRQNTLLKRNGLIVNSGLLFEKLKKYNSTIQECRTTTISKYNLFKREDTCEKESCINITYTGQIIHNKGIFDIINACAALVRQEYDIKINFAGLIFKNTMRILDEVYVLLKKHKIEDRFVFHGELKVGNELNELYRKSDIFVVASKSDFEGFPRTIWEAMANSCPVIATRVGSIPNYLKNEHDSILIDRNNLNQLIDSIKMVISNEIIRKRIIKNGFKLVSNNTLELQSKKLYNLLKSQKNGHANI